MRSASRIVSLLSSVMAGCRPQGNWLRPWEVRTRVGAENGLRSTTMTSSWPMIWQMRESHAPTDRAASVQPLENFGAFLIGEHSCHRSYLTHVHAVAIESRENASQARDVTLVHQCFPPVDIANMWLASNATSQPLQIGQDGRAPPGQGRSRQVG